MKDTNKQIVGNIGLYWVCYCLSRFGWNVMPTTRNAKGIDLLIYSQDATRIHTIQVKTVSDRAAAGFGKSPEILADYVVVCFRAQLNPPPCSILKRDELELKRNATGAQYWLDPPKYDQPKFVGKWDRIGRGAAENPDEPNG